MVQGFSKERALKLYLLGWISITNIWVVVEGKFSTTNEVLEVFFFSREEAT
jgi:hypothetical protein